MLYHERRDALVSALGAELGGRVEVVGAEAGLHLVVKLPRGVRDRELTEQAARQNLWLWPLSPCYLEKNRQQGLILGFGSTAVKEIPRAVRRLRLLLPPG